MTLTEFLLARIAEDEAVARSNLRADANHRTVTSEIVAELSARVLAECEAKMGILDLHREGPAGRHPPYCRTCEGGHGWPCATLRFLALPYADRPDCREEWKP